MKRRWRIGGPAPNAAIALFVLLVAGLLAFPLVRLDREGRATMARAISVGKDGRGGPLCDYRYVVDGRAYVNRGHCTSDPPQIDFLPDTPEKSRLHAERPDLVVAVTGLFLFALLACVLSVVAFLREPRFWRW